MSCDYAHLDGVYVLGSLSAGERLDFERHLAGCPTCARAVRELAGLPGLLSRVDPEALHTRGDEAPLPPTLLPALVREVRRSQRRRTVLTCALAAAAAAAVVTLVAVLTNGAGRGEVPTATPTSSSVQEPASLPMSSVGYHGAVRASLALASVAWGTRLDLTCAYNPEAASASPTASASASAGGDVAQDAATYALVVHTRDGRTEQVATWRALPGRTMQLAGATSARRDDIASVEVRTSEGRPVFRLRL